MSRAVTSRSVVKHPGSTLRRPGPQEPGGKVDHNKRQKRGVEGPKGKAVNFG